MNVTQRIQYLKKELKALKKLLDKDGLNMLRDKHWGNAQYYNVYTKDHKEYVIGATTYDFPKINFNDIIYIHKKLNNFKEYDIYKGEFDISEDYSYLQNMFDKFNIEETIYTGCYY